MSDRDDTRHDGELTPDAPPTAEELRSAERLRDALERPSRAATAGEDVAIVAALRAAWAPRALDEETHAELLADMPTEEERALAAELREALDVRAAPRSRASTDVATALAAAARPAPLDEAEHRAIVARALGEAIVSRAPRPRRTRAVAGATALALAASVLVWFTTGSNGTREEAPLARTRSTEPLFDAPFKNGEASARIDRIALARASDYRDNRFASWGVR